MPSPLERFPVPTLTTYAVLSLSLFVFLIYNVEQVTKDPSWKNEYLSSSKNLSDLIMEDEAQIIELDSFNIPDQFKEIILYVIQDSFSRWVFINTVTCAIIIFGKIVQRVTFGDLRTVEIINFREKLCNYFLYKFIFMFGVIKVQTAEDVMLLLGWFGVLGFLQIFVQFAKDRLEYMVTVSSRVTFWNRCKIVALLLCLFSMANYMIYLCLTYGVNLGYNIFAFMIAECLSITLRVPHILIKYVMDPFEAKFIRGQNRSRNSFANFIMYKMEMSLTYYISLGLELADLCLELLHYLHMLLWGNIFFSVASLAICMHVRYLMTEIQRKIKKHRNYMWILNHMEKEYPIASPEELHKNSDNCAICWEKMELARKLPCGHLFHTTCLQLWLEQDTSCPTCRFVLNINGSNVRRSGAGTTRQARGGFRFVGNVMPGINRQHFFHFDGSRYVSWLPSFSVQVMSTIGGAEVSETQFETMARQVQQIFPHYPTNVLVEDLRQTRSVTVTIDNILDGRIPVAENQNAEFSEEESSTGAQSTSANTTDDVSSEAGSSTSSSYRIHKSDYNEDGNDTSTGDTTTEDEDNNTFSVNPSEREVALRNRKEKLFLNAKKKYLEKRLVK